MNHQTRIVSILVSDSKLKLNLSVLCETTGLSNGPIFLGKEAILSDAGAVFLAYERFGGLALSSHVTRGIMG